MVEGESLEMPLAIIPGDAREGKGLPGKSREAPIQEKKYFYASLAFSKRVRSQSSKPLTNSEATQYGILSSLSDS